MRATHLPPPHTYNRNAYALRRLTGGSQQTLFSAHGAATYRCHLALPGMHNSCRHTSFLSPSFSNSVTPSTFDRCLAQQTTTTRRANFVIPVLLAASLI